VEQRSSSGFVVHGHARCHVVRELQRHSQCRTTAHHGSPPVQLLQQRALRCTSVAAVGRRGHDTVTPSASSGRAGLRAASSKKGSSTNSTQIFRRGPRQKMLRTLETKFQRK
jgi:hypothetical protein